MLNTQYFRHHYLQQSQTPFDILIQPSQFLNVCKLLKHVEYSNFFNFPCVEIH
jgi:hypothetical protein